MAESLLLSEIANLPPPAPWRDGDNIPWHDPAFSERMLQEHLSQLHDAASRRFEAIDAHVDWLHRNVLGKRPRKVLDLGCGPGLYSSRLARLGHRCIGIDYSPASIRYAKEQARAEGLDSAYRCEDIRNAQFGDGYGIAMLLFGELNVFRPSDARALLMKAREALAPDGVLVIEPHTHASVEATAARPRNWYFAPKGLFSDQPHLYLQEQAWDAGTKTTTRRYIIVDAATARGKVYAQTFQAYSDEEYRSLLRDCGFGRVDCYPSLTGETSDNAAGLVVLVART
jgi:SAM-dependent methyltransferase